jgi:PPOX class probable F420-dependent enzyme
LTTETAATSVIPEDKLDLLEAAAIAHVATLGPNGEPQVTPIWFGYQDGHILFSQTTTRQKFKNLHRDARSAVSIVVPANAYRYLEVRGTVVRFDPDPDLDFINSMAKKYMGVDKYPWHNPGDERVVVVIRPEHTTSMG